MTLFFVRNRAPAYGPEDTPEGVVRNYVVALQLNDYERAYGYLAKQENGPSYEAFRRAFLTGQVDARNAALQIGEGNRLGGDEAWVTLTIQYGGYGVFDRGYSQNDKATLIRQNGAWKITYLPYPFWGYDWYLPTPITVP